MSEVSKPQKPAKEERIDINVRIYRETYERLMHYILTHYKRTYGYMSKVIEDAIREYLDRHFKEEEEKGGGSG